jgi:hypothetical protein
MLVEGGTMRSSQSFVVALLAGVFGLMPLSVVAQGNGFLILSKPTPLNPTIHVIDCAGIKDGKVTCKIVEQPPCKPGACSFHKEANVADYPNVAVYGVSGKSTCAWVYHAGLYYPVCW